MHFKNSVMKYTHINKCESNDLDEGTEKKTEET